jgi:hypothetical protein
MAVEFYVSEPCWLTSVGVFRSGSNQTATVTAQLFQVTGTTTGSAVGASFSVPVSAAGWNNAGPAAPIALTANQRYRMVCLFPDFATKVLNYFTTGPGASGITNGLLTAPSRANATNNAQNAFLTGAALTYPTTANSDGPSYGIDVIVTDVDPSAGLAGTASPIYGFDTSSVYGAVDMSAMKTNGMAFAICRVGQGASISGNVALNDSLWTTNQLAARANGLPLGGYWYIGDSESPGAQAARCLSVIGDPGIALVMDWELGSWANLLACVAAFRAAGLNPKLLYSRYTFYQSGGGQDLVPLKLALWNSRYPSSSTGTPSGLYAAVASDRATYWQTYGGITTKLLQYTSSATVGTYNNADITAFNGSTADVADLLAPASGMAFLPLFPDRVKVS